MNADGAPMRWSALSLWTSALREARKYIRFFREICNQVDHGSLYIRWSSFHRTRVERWIWVIFAHQLSTLGIGLIAQLSNHAQAKIQPRRHPSTRNPVTVAYNTRFGWNCTKPGQSIPARPVRSCLKAL